MPVITGLSTISGWTNIGSGLYEKTLSIAPANSLNMVVFNGQVQPIGRFPKAGLGDLSYYYINSHTVNVSGNVINSHTVSSNQIGSIPNFTGGELVQRTMQWIFDRSTINYQTSTTIASTPENSRDHPTVVYEPIDGHGFFFQNHINTLTSLGDWCYSKNTKKITMFFGANNPDNYTVEVSSADKLIDIQAKNYIDIVNLELEGANESLLYLNATNYIKIDNCNLNFAGINAIDVNTVYWSFTTHTTVTNCHIRNTMNNAINAYESKYWMVANNLIENTALVQGMGLSGDGQYVGMYGIGDNSVVEYNEVANTGYSAIWYSGNNILIRYNHVHDYCLVKSDGGGIYSYGSYNTNRVIYKNVVHDGVGDRYGMGEQDNPYSAQVHGIYNDATTSGVTITDNTCFNNSHSGIWFGSNSWITATGNTLYNNKVAQLKSANDAIFNTIVIKNNILFAKKSGSLTASYNLNSASFNSLDLDSNYYCRPIWEPNNINAVVGYGMIPFSWDTYHDGGAVEFNHRFYSLDKWKGKLGKDAATKKTSTAIPDTNKIRFEYNGTAQSKTISLDGGYIDLKDNYYTSLVLAPYSSIILLKSESNNKISQTIDFPQLGSKFLGDLPFTISATASSGLPVSCRVVSGPAVILGSILTLIDTGTVVIEASQAGNINYSPAIPVTRSFTVNLNPGITLCTATGSILREQWENVPGTQISDIPFYLPPSGTSLITALETQNTGNLTGARIRGYICAPLTGNYTFHIAGDDAVELWLSTDNDPANKVRIAYHTYYTGFREWSKYSTQKSALINLEAGNSYYVEIVHKNGGGGDNVSVKWDMPNGVTEVPISGNRLSPYTSVNLINQTINFAPIPSKIFGDAPFNVSATASSGLPVSFRIVSGPATLSGSLLTLTGTGSVVVEASQAGNAIYNAALIVLQSFNVLPPAAATCTASGNILREQWNNVFGTLVSDIPVHLAPASSSLITGLETQNTGGNMGARIRGYICPPLSGNYTFYIAGDDGVELNLSTNNDPANKVKIAGYTGWTGFRQWNKYPLQKSDLIYLQAGQNYYIEVLHKNGGGGDHVSVKWDLPNGTTEVPVAGNHLSPYTSATTINQTINFAPLPSKTFGDAPFTLSASASSGLPISFRIASGPATISGNTITLTGTGTVIVEASQAGNATYNPAPPVIQSFDVAEPITCFASGSILREQWNNIFGTQVSNIPVQSTPSSSSQIAMLETQRTGGDMGARIRGYICPPLNGNYIFYLSGDDGVELWLSTNNDPANKVKIAGYTGWTGFHEWNKYPSQKSASINLRTDQSYYVEILHKNGGGGDHVSVKWDLPNGTTETPIGGNRLSPYTNNSAAIVTDAIGRIPEQGENLSETNKKINNDFFSKANITVYPNPFNSIANIQVNPTETEEAIITLNDPQGRAIKQIYKGKLETNQAKILRLSPEGLADGVYMIRLVTKTKNIIHKILLVR